MRLSSVRTRHWDFLCLIRRRRMAGRPALHIRIHRRSANRKTGISIARAGLATARRQRHGPRHHQARGPSRAQTPRRARDRNLHRQTRRSHPHHRPPLSRPNLLSHLLATRRRHPRRQPQIRHDQHPQSQRKHHHPRNPRRAHHRKNHSRLPRLEVRAIYLTG